jgi:O-antigen/teichoic acid export membrane protein
MEGPTSKSNLSRLITSFASYSLGDFILFGLSYVVLIPVLTSHLSPEDYGIVATLTASSIMLGFIMQFGLPSTAMRYFFLYEEGDSRRSYFGTIWLLSLGVSGAIALAAIGFGRPIWDSFIRNASFKTYAGYVIFGAFFQVVTVFRSVLLRAMERPRLYVVLDVAQFLLVIVFVVYQVVVLKKGALGQVRGSFYGYAVFSAISAWFVARHVRFRPQWQHIRASLAFAFPVFLTYIIGFFVSRVNVLILQYFVVGGAVGIFALGQQLSNLISMLAAAFDKAWQPFLYSSDPDKARRISALYIVFATPVYMTIALSMGLYAPEIIRFISPKSYSSAWSVIAISVFGMAFVALSSASNGAIYYAKRSNVTAWITAFAALINIGLNFLTIPKWGLEGAVWTSLFVGIVILVLSFWAMQRFFPTTLPYRPVIGTIGLGVVFLAAGSWFFNIHPFVSPPAVLMMKAAFLLGYLIVLQFLGFIPRREIAEIKLYLKDIFKALPINSMKG